MHVGRGQGHVSECGGPEAKASTAGVRLGEKGVLHHTFGVELEVGEHRSAVAPIASDGIELPHAALLLLREGRRISALEAVPRCVDRRQAPLIGRHRLSERFRLDPL